MIVLLLSFLVFCEVISQHCPYSLDAFKMGIYTGKRLSGIKLLIEDDKEHVSIWHLCSLVTTYVYQPVPSTSGNKGNARPEENIKHDSDFINGLWVSIESILASDFVDIKFKLEKLIGKQTFDGFNDFKNFLINNLFTKEKNFDLLVQRKKIQPKVKQLLKIKFVMPAMKYVEDLMRDNTVLNYQLEELVREVSSLQNSNTWLWRVILGLAILTVISVILNAVLFWKMYYVPLDLQDLGERLRKLEPLKKEK